MEPAHHGPHHRRHRRRPVAWAPDGSGSRGRPSDNGATPALRRRPVPVRGELPCRRQRIGASSSRSPPASQRGCGRAATAASRSMAPRRRRRARHELRRAAEPAPDGRVGVRPVVPRTIGARATPRSIVREQCCDVPSRRGAFVHASSHATAELARDLLGDRTRRGRASRTSPTSRRHVRQTRASGSTADRSFSRSARSSAASR